jgi:beta-fructofuranosidase
VVTGFRDPFLAKWPALDEIRGQKGGKSLYGSISGGISNKGPTAFLYTVASHDLTNWTYLGPLTSILMELREPSPWTSNLGINWECVNFLSLRDGPTEFQFLTMGAEGVPRLEASEDEMPHVSRPLWMAGSLKSTRNGITMEQEMSGILDYGCFYAGSSYEHPVSHTRIVWGWLKEEDLTLARRESKGWTGCLSLPRELFLLCIRGVTKSLKTPLEDISSTKIVDDESNESSQGEKRKNLYTLGIRPYSGITLLRQSPSQVWTHLGGGHGPRRLTALERTSWEMEALVKIESASCCLGFHINHNDDLSQRVTVYFSSENEAIGIDCSRSNKERDIKKSTVRGPFTLFTLIDNGAEAMEMLHLRIFRDGDIVEVFANDRFVLSSFAYADSAFRGISYFVDGHGSDSVVFEYVRVWENLESCMIEAA